MIVVVITFARDMLVTFDDVTDSWGTLQARTEQKADTRITWPNVQLAAILGTSTVQLTLVNEGKVATGKFSEWDVFFESRKEPGLEIASHTYTTSTSPAVLKWGIKGIYRDAPSSTAEIVDPGVLNPDEKMIALVNASTTLVVGGYNRVTFVMPNGITAKVIFQITLGSFYLNNDPTPPTDHTDSQAVLPMNGISPTATTLYNYDKNRDSLSGLLIIKGGTGPGESDSTKRQVWRSGTLFDPLTLEGSVSIDLWSAMKDFALGKAGDVAIFLRDYNGSTHIEIGSGTSFDADWHGGSNTWVKSTITITGLDHTVPTGNELEVELLVGSSADDDMWFAYDTESYPSVIVIPSSLFTK